MTEHPIVNRIMRAASQAAIQACMAICLAATLVSGTDATTYFVSQSGNDIHDGKSWDRPWRTLKKAVDAAVAGDTVLIRKGPLPYRGFVTARSGTAENPITFLGELPNDPPVISGGYLETRWTPSGTRGVWTVATSVKPIFVFEDGQVLAAASSPQCAEGRWFWDDKHLYYKPSSGDPGSHTVWRQAMGGGAGIDNHSWIILENLSFWLGGGSGVTIRGNNAHDNRINNVTVQWHWRGINITGGASHNVIENCLLQNNMDGIYLSGNASHNVVRHCRAIHNGNAPHWKKSDRAGIAIGGNGINRDNTLEHNEVAYNGGPGSDPGLIAYQAPNTIIRYNHVHHNYGAGLFVTIQSNGSKVFRNRVEYNGIDAVADGHKGASGLSVRRSRGVEVIENTVIGNHVSSDSSWPGKDLGPRGGLELRGLPHDDMRDIKFINNVVKETVGGPDIFIHRAPDTSGFVIEQKQD